MAKLLDQLTAVRGAPRSVLRDNAPMPPELANNIARVFDDLDAAIEKLLGIIRRRAVPV